MEWCQRLNTTNTLEVDTIIIVCVAIVGRSKIINVFDISKVKKYTIIDDHVIIHEHLEVDIIIVGGGHAEYSFCFV